MTERHPRVEFFTEATNFLKRTDERISHRDPEYRIDMEANVRGVINSFVDWVHAGIMDWDTATRFFKNAVEFTEHGPKGND